MISGDVRTIAGRQRQPNKRLQTSNEFDFLEIKNKIIEKRTIKKNKNEKPMEEKNKRNNNRDKRLKERKKSIRKSEKKEKRNEKRGR